jgi:dipeptidyl aminopeptidase/acylaminoacyl peptidase
MSRVVAIALSVLAIAEMAIAQQVRTIRFISTYDQTPQYALVQIPSHYDPTKPAPALIFVHGMYTDAQSAIDYMGRQCNRRGWFVLAPEQHGARSSGATALGAPEAQHDIMDGLAALKRTYKVDPFRVYLVGISMGGLTAALTLENFPRSFAGGALLMGLFDLGEWYHEVLQPSSPYGKRIAPDIVKECGGTPQQAPQEYTRRSALGNAGRLAGIPLFISHGRQDQTVPPIQAEQLIQAIMQTRPDDVYVNWVDADHSQERMDLEKLGDFLVQFRLPTSGTGQK